MFILCPNLFLLHSVGLLLCAFHVMFCTSLVGSVVCTSFVCGLYDSVVGMNSLWSGLLSVVCMCCVDGLYVLCGGRIAQGFLAWRGAMG